jgi:hypothetical protein
VFVVEEEKLEILQADYDLDILLVGHVAEFLETPLVSMAGELVAAR